MPWELQLLQSAGQSRWLRTKSGDIDQFATQLAFDPAAKLAVFMATNGAAMAPKAVPNQISTILFPAFANALANFEQWNPPKRYRDMIGVYTAYVASVSAVMTANITVQTESAEQPTIACVFSWDENGFSAVIVEDESHSSQSDGVDSFHAILHLAKNPEMPCMLDTELAWDGERIVFDAESKSMQVPGMLTVTFKKND